MSTYIAKKVNLSVMRECIGKDCNCFTDNGYYIQYRNGNVDSMLFVCEDCYNSQYKSKCTIGSFNEEEYQRNVQRQRYYNGNPTLRQFLKLFHKGIRISRTTIIVSALIITSAFCLKERPSMRGYYQNPEIRLNIHTGAHGTNEIRGQIQSVIDRIAILLSNDGGKTNDQ